MTNNIFTKAYGLTGDTELGAQLGRGMRSVHNSIEHHHGEIGCQSPSVLQGYARHMLREVRLFVEGLEAKALRVTEEEQPTVEGKPTTASELEAMGAFSEWYNRLPEDTRQMIENTCMLVLFQNAFECGQREHRAGQGDGLDLIERNLVETLNVVEILRKS